MSTHPADRPCPSTSVLLLRSTCPLATKIILNSNDIIEFRRRDLYRDHPGDCLKSVQSSDRNVGGIVRAEITLNNDSIIAGEV